MGAFDRRGFAFFWGLMFAPSGYAVQLEIPTVHYDDGGWIQFRVIPQQLGRVTAGDNIGQSRSFYVYSEPAICTYDDQWRLFQYKLFLRNIHHDQRLPFLVNAQPSPGSFIDGFRYVAFTITEGTNTETGTIRLPLHSLSKDHSLAVNMGDKPFEFRLGSDNPIPIRFQNNLKDMKVIVESVGVSYQQPEFWATPAPQLTPNLIIAELGSETFEQIRLRASAASAIPGAFFRHGGGADTYLNLKIRYAAQSCGRPMDLLVNVPVRFIPSLRFLALAVVGGALMGGIARLAEKKRRMSVNAWLRAFVTACLGAALLELLGIVLVELDSVFVVFGMRLDPYQFPQVLLMAALVGVLGVNISDQLRRVMGD